VKVHAEPLTDGPEKQKTSSGVRPIEDVKQDIVLQEQAIKTLQERIEDYDNGWTDDFEDTPRKRANLERQLKRAESGYVRLTEELEDHPDYYADKYRNVGGLRKATTGILGSTIATVPVIVETTAAALKEAEAKGTAEDYSSALQAEKTAWNRMNDYVSSHFGSFDMINQDELDRLSREYQKASDYRKSLESKYEQPVDTDSWGMNLMEESAWLKNSATENLDGFGKVVADTAIDIGQNVALTPLLLGGPKTYIAGLAANAAAEEMYGQTTKGKAPHEAFVSGALTAGAEVAKNKVSKIKLEEKIPVKEMIEGIKKEGENFATEFLEKILSNEMVAQKAIPKITKETINYFLDFLEEKAKTGANAQFSGLELLQSGLASGIEGFASESTQRIYELIEEAWKTLG